MSNDRAPDVVGPEEATALLHVNRSRFYQLRARPDFPAGRELACGTVYDRRAILAYHLSRQRRRPMLRALQVYRETGTVAAAARAVDRDPSTVRGWLRELEEPLPRETALDAPARPGSTAAILQERVRELEAELAHARS